MQVLKFPLAKITFAFVCGILVCNFTTIEMYQLFAIGSIVTTVLIAVYFIASSEFYQKIYFGAAVFLLSFIAGMLALAINRSANNPKHYRLQVKSEDEKVNISLSLREELKATAKNYRYIAKIKRVDQHATEGFALLNIKRDSSEIHYAIGTQLQLQSKFIKNEKPLNPDQFDYGKYLSNKSIDAQIFVKRNDIILLPKSEKSVFFYTDKLRKRIIHNLKKSDFNDRELAVLSALILGQRQEIAPDILQDYQYAGAVHILSVSGLHVGFIILFINSFLKFLPPTRSARILKLILTLFSLWAFAVLASLSPSVVRAVTMFSFVAIGMYLNRSTNIFHTLFVSILIILLFQPQFIFDVGFQLSYIALFSILWLQPILKRLWETKNKVVSYFWDIITVSFAAQIGAFPISVFYFHQFPALFFVTNLLIIPLLSIIMALGIFSMGIAAFANVPSFVVSTLEFLLRMMNSSIKIVASFENFIFQNIPMTFGLLISTYLIIIATFKWIEKPTYRKLLGALLSIIVFFSTYFTLTKYNYSNSQWMVFNQRGNSLILKKEEEKLFVYSKAKPNKWETNSIQSFATANYLTIIKRTLILNFYHFKSNRIAVVDSSASFVPNVKTDVLLLIQSPKVNLERLIQSAQPEIIVADATNFPYLKHKWQTTCAKAKIPFHDTSEKGFFIIE